MNKEYKDFTYASPADRSFEQHNLGVLATIVQSLKQRFLEGDNEPLDLSTILDETHQTNISKRQRTWLENQALEQNIRIKVVHPEAGDGPIKYQYKPVLNIKDTKLRRFLEKHYQSGQGAILMDDILESMPNADRTIRWLIKNDLIVVITRPLDKKKLVFYNDGRQEFKVDEEFQKLWRSVSVDGVAEDKIEEYLEVHGIQSIQNMAARKFEPVQKRRKTARKPNKNFKSHNEHMKDILEDYTEK